ncbi:membrane-bound metal-dependent hydrolase [Methanosalsum zhilinae DSM 4017]|uniref:Membrane-bound metal-dependent hydrolase n=1 Tax=Methanosalsum zhilinae (strain DSM 4017 / NBRC 107636 / OCM 62 / WeN5) TaxID=679901 RepID=F7XMM0_METZD|nr:metal-dependent hydrolase [Methanosalsum zhilinae]AEH61035.1 membrane-bound metal-dependent hydrolase [Methanosalsum zhilinae DSM 4017]
MVNSISHFGIGFLIASFLGFKGRERVYLGLIAVIPDLDFIPNIIFFAIEDALTYELRTQLFYLMVHREFMHSLLFILIITSILWFWKKNRLFTFTGFLVLLSHFFLDYATSWKMRPLYPFINEPSTLGSMYFFDPVISVISIIPILIFLLDIKMKNKVDAGKNWLNKIYTYAKKNERLIYNILVVIFVIWCAVTPFAKYMLVNEVSEIEDAKISYQNTYPVSPASFISAYSFNDSHYKIMEISYHSVIKRSDYVEKITYTDSTYEYLDTDINPYIERAYELYASNPAQQIDYPVYSVMINESSVTVVIGDARSKYVRFWAYFVVEYEFVFDRSYPEGKFVAFFRDQQGNERKAPDSWFRRNS